MELTNVEWKTLYEILKLADYDWKRQHRQNDNRDNGKNDYNWLRGALPNEGCGLLVAARPAEDGGVPTRFVGACATPRLRPIATSWTPTTAPSDARQ